MAFYQSVLLQFANELGIAYSAIKDNDIMVFFKKLLLFKVIQELKIVL